MTLIFLVLGALISAANWLAFFPVGKRRKRFAPVPFLGAVLLGLGAYPFLPRGELAALALAADYGTLDFFIGLPDTLFKMFPTSEFALLKSLRGDKNGSAYTLRLYKSGVFTLKAATPGSKTPAGKSRCKGVWRKQNGVFMLEGCWGKGFLALSPENEKYVAEEKNRLPGKDFGPERLSGAVFEEDYLP